MQGVGRRNEGCRGMGWRNEGCRGGGAQGEVVEKADFREKVVVTVCICTYESAHPHVGVCECAHPCAAGAAAISVATQGVDPKCLPRRPVCCFGPGRRGHPGLPCA